MGIFCIFEYMLVDLLNMLLFLPGNLLCYVPPFKKYMIQVFATDWFGKNTHISSDSKCNFIRSTETNFG